MVNKTKIKHYSHGQQNKHKHDTIQLVEKPFLTLNTLDVRSVHFTTSDKKIVSMSCTCKVYIGCINRGDNLALIY